MARTRSAVETAARATEAVRWALVPLALCALVAVGAHAAADVLGDRIFGVVDRLSALVDSFFSRWPLTEPLVDLVGVQQRTLFARGAAFLLELWADALLALPMLAYTEKPGEAAAALAQLRKWAQRPGTLRISRPVFTAAVALSGACSVARLAHGSMFVAVRGLAGAGAAGAVARAAGLAALVGLLALFAFRAVLQGLAHADARADAKARSKRRALTAGLAGSLLLSPIAWTAVVHASPLLSFLR